MISNLELYADSLCPESGKVFVPLDLSKLTDITRNTLHHIRRLGSIDGIYLCQDAITCNEVNELGFDFGVLFQFMSNEEDAMEERIEQNSAERIHRREDPAGWKMEDKNYNKMRQRTTDQVKKYGLAPGHERIKFRFLRIFCGFVLAKNRVVGPIRLSYVYNHVLVNELLRRYSAACAGFPMPPSGHREIIKANKRLRHCVGKIIDNFLEPRVLSQWFAPHQLFAVLLMPMLEAIGEHNHLGLEKLPKCHCASSVLATTAVYSIGQVARGYNKKILHELESSIMLIIEDSTFALYMKHPHFCGHCGLFEDKRIKLKVCKLCKKQEILTRFMFCSNECQIKSWPYHKWLHRARKIAVELN